MLDRLIVLNVNAHTLTHLIHILSLIIIADTFENYIYELFFPFSRHYYVDQECEKLEKQFVCVLRITICLEYFK